MRKTNYEIDNKFQQHQHQHGNPVPVSMEIFFCCEFSIPASPKLWPGKREVTSWQFARTMFYVTACTTGYAIPAQKDSIKAKATLNRLI